MGVERKMRQKREMGKNENKGTDIKDNITEGGVGMGTRRWKRNRIMKQER